MPKNKGKGKGRYNNKKGNNKGTTTSPAVVAVLMGLPGSGKSTFAKDLIKNENWVRVNQDDLGSCAICRNVMEKTLKKKKSVVVDRCNVSKGERKMWIQIAKKYGTSSIELIVFDVSVEECVSRVKDRKDHPTLGGDKAEGVIVSFSKRWQEPTPYEGFDTIKQVSTRKEVRDEVIRLSSLHPSKKK